MAGIYIHIPYCRKACHYCSFHFSTNLGHKSQFLTALNKEIVLRSDELKNSTIESIYFGGGTPSLLSSKELSDILQTISTHYLLAQKVEITLEANPEDITSEHLIEWHKLSINRLSIGIQSFIDRDLKYMNRVHSAAQSHHALNLINHSAFENVTIDLMFGLINSNLEEWKFNLDALDQYRITHLSVYNLTIEEQTVFSNWKVKKKLIELPEAYQEQQFNYASESLKTKGFDHYEISNYGLPGFHSVHNTNYWQRISYLGFGPSAHSYNRNVRSWNQSNNVAYINMIERKKFVQDHEQLDSFDIYNEMIMLGLRTSKGIHVKKLDALPQDIQHHFIKESSSFFDDQILIRKNNYIQLQEKSWYLSDNIASQLFISKE